jgi:hypothetical protein
MSLNMRPPPFNASLGLTCLLGPLRVNNPSIASITRQIPVVPKRIAWLSSSSDRHTIPRAPIIRNATAYHNFLSIAAEKLSIGVDNVKHSAIERENIRSGLQLSRGTFSCLFERILGFDASSVYDFVTISDS